MAKKNKVKVHIMNQEYVICSDDSREFIQRVANYVDDKMREVKGTKTVFNVKHLSVLTAINIADNYLKLHDDNKNAAKLPKKEERRLNAVIQSLSDEIEKKNQEAQILEETLAQLEQDYNNQKINFETLSVELMKKNDEIKHKVQEILTKEDEMIEKDKQIQLQAEHIEYQNEQIQQKESQISELMEQLGNNEELFVTRVDEFNRLKKENIELAKKLNDARQELDDFINTFDN